MTNIIDGTKIARTIQQELKEKIARLSEKPGLAIILIGDDPGSHIYVDLKEKAARAIGMYFEKHIFPASVAEQKVVTLIRQLNIDEKVHGIVVQFPLPAGFHKETIISAVVPEKDVDGFHPESIRALLAGKARMVPGLAAGIIQLIESTGELLAGKKAVVVANSTVFSEPLGYLLKQRGVQTAACNPDEKNCQSFTSGADILVVAVGRPNFITASMVKKGAIVIDVGYNRVRGRAAGDVDFASVREKAGWITPVPGGVGPMTVAMLLANVLKAYEIRR